MYEDQREGEKIDRVWDKSRAAADGWCKEARFLLFPGGI